MIKVLYILMVAMIILLFTFGIDREIARKDFNKYGGSANCLFKINCAYFNNL